MNFYLLPLAYLAVCGLSNAAPNPQRLPDEVEAEFKSKQCDPGWRPARVRAECTGERAGDPLCHNIVVECVPISPDGPPPPRVKITGRPNSVDVDKEKETTQCPAGQTATLVYAECAPEVEPVDCSYVGIACLGKEYFAPSQPNAGSAEGTTGQGKTDEELDREMAHMVCPFGKRPARVQGLCLHARDNIDCPDIHIACVQQSFGNNPASTPPPGSGPSGSPKTQEELDNELLHKECVFPQRPAYVKERCPEGATDTLDCAHMEVRCVQSSFGNTQPSTPQTDGARPVGTPKTQEELDQEMAHKQCPSGQKAAQVKEKCPYGASNHLDCPTTEVRCVQLSFGNEPPSTGGKSPSGARKPIKTQERLEFEMAHWTCPATQRPAFIKESCPSGATDTADCPPSEVRCVQSSFANDQPPTAQPPSNRPRPPVKTQQELDQEMMHMDCPFGQRAAQVKEKCPYSAFDSWFCPPTEVKCVQSSFGNAESTTRSREEEERYHEQNRWAAEHPDTHIGKHRGEEFFRNPKPGFRG